MCEIIIGYINFYLFFIGKSGSFGEKMGLKGIVRELKDLRDGIGNISRRSSDGRQNSRRRGRSHIAPEGSTSSTSSVIDQSQWANMPPELLLDIIQRVESSQTSWPARRDVVACASVCKSWRAITKEIVKTPEQCGLLSFPISLKQVAYLFPFDLLSLWSLSIVPDVSDLVYLDFEKPGPRDAPIQCFIRRERAAGIYRLYLGLSPGNYCKSYALCSLVSDKFDFAPF